MALGGLNFLSLWHVHNPSGAAPADTTAPTLSSPTGTQTGSTTATIGVTTDEANGTLYGVVTTSTTPPSKAQVKAGQNHLGAAASAVPTPQAISATGAKTMNATGLTASTTYYSHFMHEDAATNQSNVSSYTTGFTTAYSPLALFGGGEGLWLDPTDLTTMWTTSAKTTQVSADGDPIGYIADKSGNGHDFSQATSANRPTWKTSGGFSWIEFGTAQDKWLSGTLPSATFGGNLSKTIILGVRPTANTGGPAAFFIGDEGALSTWAVEETGGGITLAAFDATGDLQVAASQSTVGHTIVGLKNGNDISLYKNGSVIGGPSTKAAMNITSNAVVLGRELSGGGWKGRIYGAIIVPSALSSGNITAGEAWMAARSNVGA